MVVTPKCGYAPKGGYAKNVVTRMQISHLLLGVEARSRVVEIGPRELELRCELVASRRRSAKLLLAKDQPLAHLKKERA